MEFIDKNILVTGASTGIGKSIVEELSLQKCNIFILARRINLLEEIQSSLKSNPAQIYPIKCDVSKRDEVQSAYTEIKSKVDSLDLAILNSGVGIREKLENYNAQSAETTFGTNVFGLVYWVETLLPDFLKARKGTIAGVSSQADNRGFSGSGLYCASKAAATIYLEGLRNELKPKGIKVITIRPGFVKTPMTDKNNFQMPFLISAEKAAKIILRGIRKEKSLIQFPLPTVIGSTLVGMLPSKVYDLIGNKLS